jgi:hypothetical protein
VISIDKYPYVGIKYRGDQDMPFSLDSTYGDIGMKKFLYISFFCVFQKD